MVILICCISIEKQSCALGNGGRAGCANTGSCDTDHQTITLVVPVMILILVTSDTGY